MLENANAISARLFELRNIRGETQEEVAEAVGISYVSLSRYETGQRMPKMNILAKLADHYNVTVDEILGRTLSGDQLQIISEPERQMLDKARQLTPENHVRINAYIEGLLAGQGNQGT